MAAPSDRPEGLRLDNWDLGGEASAWAYLNAGRLFHHAEIPVAGPSAQLAARDDDAIASFRVKPRQTLAEYVQQAPVDGVIVVRQGEIVFERYPRMRPTERHLLMSVSKVVVAVLVGLLEMRGILDVHAPAASVVGELASGGWRRAKVDDVLNMRSGIACLEVGEPGSYYDPNSCFYRFEASLGWRPPLPDGPSRPYEFVAQLPAHRTPGQAYEYTGVNTFALSWMIERATGGKLESVIRDEIWRQIGFESAGQLCLAADGAPVSHGGLSMSLRDLARLGLIFTPSAHLVTAQPERYRRLLEPIWRAGRSFRLAPRRSPSAAAQSAYGSHLPPPARQWNIVTPDGDLFKGGFGGQGLYISPSRDIVIAFFGSPRADGDVNELRWHAPRLALELG